MRNAMELGNESYVLYLRRASGIVIKSSIILELSMSECALVAPTQQI